MVAELLAAGEAYLGSGLFKKRLARPGGGKSGGFRTIVAYHAPHGERVLFVYAYAKNASSTITPVGQEALGRTAAQFVMLTDSQVLLLIEAGKVVEILETS